MADLFELIVGFIAARIYGLENRPRHPILRNFFRVVAFGGSVLLLAALWTSWEPPEFTRFFILPWLLCSGVVLLGEYELGSKPLGLTALLLSVLLVASAMVRFVFV